MSRILRPDGVEIPRCRADRATGRIENPGLRHDRPEILDSPIFKDDQGVWYIPTDWGATAVAYNTENVPAEDVASLNIFIDPKYQGRTSLPDRPMTSGRWPIWRLGVTD